MESYKDKMINKVNQSKFNIPKPIKNKRWEYRILECIKRNGEKTYKLQFRHSNILDKLISPSWNNLITPNDNDLEVVKNWLEKRIKQDEEFIQNEIIQQKVIK